MAMIASLEHLASQLFCSLSRLRSQTLAQSAKGPIFMPRKLPTSLTTVVYSVVGGRERKTHPDTPTLPPWEKSVVFYLSNTFSIFWTFYLFLGIRPPLIGSQTDTSLLLIPTL